MILLERKEAQDALRKAGNAVEGTVAAVFDPNAEWLVVIDYDDAGYVDDSDAGQLDADEMLSSFREGTRQQNERRKALGQPELTIDGWSERPRYERTQHHLVWGIAGHDTGGKVINFFTRILGRKGYLSVNLIDDPARIEASKKQAIVILEATRFRPGNRYEDHASGDKSSGLGLRTLVLGGAGVALASKLGLLAKILLVLKKGFVVIVLGVGGLFRWLFRRKPRDEVVSAPPPDDAGTSG